MKGDVFSFMVDTPYFTLVDTSYSAAGKCNVRYATERGILQGGRNKVGLVDYIFDICMI